MCELMLSSTVKYVLGRQKNGQYIFEAEALTRDDYGSRPPPRLVCLDVTRGNLSIAESTVGKD